MSIADYSMYKMASNALRAAKRTLRQVSLQVSNQMKIKNRLSRINSNKKLMLQQQAAAKYQEYQSIFQPQIDKALADKDTNLYQSLQQKLYSAQMAAQNEASIFQQMQEQEAQQQIEQAQYVQDALEQRKEDAQAEVDYWSEAKKHYHQEYQNGIKDMFGGGRA